MQNEKYGPEKRKLCNGAKGTGNKRTAVRQLGVCYGKVLSVIAASNFRLYRPSNSQNYPAGASPHLGG